MPVSVDARARKDQRSSLDDPDLHSIFQATVSILMIWMAGW
jgi:hypothetical protein